MSIHADQAVRDRIGRFAPHRRPEAPIPAITPSDPVEEAALGPARILDPSEVDADFDHHAESDVACTERTFTTRDGNTAQVRVYGWVEADEFGELGTSRYRRPGQIDYLPRTATCTTVIAGDGTVVSSDVVFGGDGDGEQFETLREGESWVAEFVDDVDWGEHVDPELV